MIKLSGNNNLNKVIVLSGEVRRTALKTAVTNRKYIILSFFTTTNQKLFNIFSILSKHSLYS